LSIESLNGFLGLRPLGELDERKPAGPSRFTVDREHDLRWRCNASEIATKVGLGGGVGEVANEQTDSQSTISWTERTAGNRGEGNES